MTFHFGETPTNRLTNPATDPLCRIRIKGLCHQNRTGGIFLSNALLVVWFLTDHHIIQLKGF